MKIKDFDLEKDWQDFRDTFNSYSGLSASSMTNEDLIQWMMAVTEELKRLHNKTNQIIRELKVSAE